MGAAIAPVVGLLGNDDVAVSLVMTAGTVIALLALVSVGVPATEEEVVAEPV